MVPQSPSMRERRRLRIRGIVQGVGFRPFVYEQALRCGLAGYVRNDSAGVTIEIEGERQALDMFQVMLMAQPPPLARIDALAVERLPLSGETAFAIAASVDGAARSALVTPDSATCEACRYELFNPADRRFRYPFINCTNCGPRFTIIEDIPYDRARTTMRSFAMCSACLREYKDPLDRRFHAQPNACPACGPQVCLIGQDGRRTAGDEAIRLAADRLAAGAILAIKGLGGYHLACDACNSAAVERLRLAKRREARPFAMMAPDTATVERICLLRPDERALLESHRRPIVLLQRRPDSPVALGVAPGMATLGVMLPYTPVHHLLLAALAEGRVSDVPPVLVMTSGNLSEEPIVIHDDDALSRLLPLADGVLTHNRAIHVRCDDSVVRYVAGGEQLIRRARGYAPEPIELALEAPLPLLACGGHLKNTFCLVRGRLAFLSQHIGDLSNLETLIVFREAIAHVQRIFKIEPQAIACDLHPDYLATQYAAESEIVPKIGVQHHHAHIASVLAEHGLEGPVIGIAADGSGYGLDGAIWGCEVLKADLVGFERLAHLAYVPLPGGEQAVRQPWRMAAVHLHAAYGATFAELPLPLVRAIAPARWRPLAQLIERGLNSPPTSSLGRLFDAVAALAGVSPAELTGSVSYEGQAAAQLEALAATAEDRSGEALYPFAIVDGAPVQLDIRPLLRALVDDLLHGTPAALVALRFHHSVAELLAACCLAVSRRIGIRHVALSGGVFQNRLLLERLVARLAALDFEVYVNRRVPPNDGGLSLGQAAVAAARLERGMLS